MKYTAFLILFSSFLLVGCGVENRVVDSNQAPLTSSGRSLPPDPGVAATATLLGIDVNNNGVRDEVERDLSAKIKSDSDYQYNINIANAYQRVITEDTPKSQPEALRQYKNIACTEISQTGNTYRGDMNDENYIAKITFDTPERKERFYHLFNLLGGISGSDIYPCE